MNLTKNIQEKYKKHLETIENILLKMNWVEDSRDFDRFIEKAICLRNKIKTIELDLVVDRIRKKIYDGGRIEMTDLDDIEKTGWVVPEVVKEVVRNR